MLETIEVETSANPSAAIIWLHGLGADGHDFEPLVGELVQPEERALRLSLKMVVNYNNIP